MIFCQVTQSCRVEYTYVIGENNHQVIAKKFKVFGKSYYVLPFLVCEYVQVTEDFNYPWKLCT